jgi:hypothetical protein
MPGVFKPPDFVGKRLEIPLLEGTMAMPAIVPAPALSPVLVRVSLSDTTSMLRLTSKQGGWSFLKLNTLIYVVVLLGFLVNISLTFLNTN